MLRLFKGCDGGFARDRRKTLQKILEGLATFKVVEQRLDRYPRTSKDRRTTKSIRVFDDYSHTRILSYGSTKFQFDRRKSYGRLGLSSASRVGMRVTTIAVPVAR